MLSTVGTSEHKNAYTKCIVTATVGYISYGNVAKYIYFLGPQRARDCLMQVRARSEGNRSAENCLQCEAGKLARITRAQHARPLSAYTAQCDMGCTHRHPAVPFYRYDCRTITEFACEYADLATTVSRLTQTSPSNQCVPHSAEHCLSSPQSSTSAARARFLLPTASSKLEAYHHIQYKNGNMTHYTNIQHFITV